MVSLKISSKQEAAAVPENNYVLCKTLIETGYVASLHSFSEMFYE
jgi:hypothetical protein